MRQTMIDFQLSRNGIEMHFATNAFGHFVLVNNLLPLLEKSNSGRIVIISSGLYKGVRNVFCTFVLEKNKKKLVTTP